MEFNSFCDGLEDDFESGSTNAGYLIEFTQGWEVKKVHVLHEEGRRYKIGRAPTNDIVMTHLSISNKHGAMEAEEGVLWVSDNGSTNYTRVGRSKPGIGCSPNKALK